MQDGYNKYSDFLKKQFQEKVHKITVDAGFTCPNRDGKLGFGGCSYCNNEKFYKSTPSEVSSICEIVQKKIIQFKLRNPKVNRFIVYFQTYSNTYGKVDYLHDLYSQVLKIDKVVGISIGTRSDCVDDEKLDMIKKISKNHYVCLEYGLESIKNETLLKINRGHDISSFVKAVTETKKRNIDVCAHLIFGFPWESSKIAVESAHFINSLGIDFVKIHQLQVVKNTKMHNDYLKNRFDLLNLDEYTKMVGDFIGNLNDKVIIQRLSGDCPNEILTAQGFIESSRQFRQHFSKYLNDNNISQGSLL